MTNKVKVIRTASVPFSLDVLLPGQLRYLNRNFEVAALSGKGHHLDVVRQREGVRTIAIGIKRQISPFHDLVSLFRLYRVFKKERPQIVHSITPKAGLLSMWAARFAGVPVRIHTFTGLLFPHKTGFLQKLLVATDKLICKFATHVIPEGKGVKNDLEAFKITNKPLQVIANGNVNGLDVRHFDPTLFSPGDVAGFKETHHINQGDLVFAYIGRKVKDKGNNELLEAFGKLNTQCPNTRLLYVGPFEKNGPLSDKSQQLLKQLEASKAVISFGFEKDVRVFLKVADVLVLPSYREGFPNVLLQALAMQTPCIATNVCGSNEIVANGTNGFLVEKKDSHALYEAMKQYTKHPALVQQHAKNAREGVCAKFENTIVWQALKDFYIKCLTDAKLETH